MAGEVADAGVGGLAFGSAQAGSDGLRGDLGCGAGGLAVQDRKGPSRNNLYEELLCG